MSEFKIGRMVLGMVRTNCYFIYNEATREAVVIDPADAGKSIYKALEEHKLRPCAILLTHGHFDHIMGTNELRRESGAEVYAAGAEQDVLESADLNCSAQTGRLYTVKADKFVGDLDVLHLAGFEIQVIETPGHTHGSVCYYLKNERVLICGDTLFEESVGRTDLPTGSQSQLVRSIREKLMCLDDEIVVYPGHGESTTIGHERTANPFF